MRPVFYQTMTIESAITLLLCAKEGFPVNDAEPYYKAMELGVEALTRVLFYRADSIDVDYGLLPGETEE